MLQNTFSLTIPHVAEIPSPRVVKPQDGHRTDFTTFGARYMVDTAESGGGFSLIEHTIPPNTLAAPLHRHSREDEYSFVLEGRLGVQLGEEVVYISAGSLVFKPRNQWHTFWNEEQKSCRILEIISPGGFEHLFKEMEAHPDFMTGVPTAVLDAKYGLEVDYNSPERLCKEHGISFTA